MWAAHRLRKIFTFKRSGILIGLQIIAILGGLLPMLWLDVRVEYDDGWFTIAGYEWAFHGVPRIPAFARSGTGDDIIHALWPMVSGTAAIGIRLLSGLIPFVACARLPMVIASLAAILLLGIRGSKVLGEVAAWGAAAFLALDSAVFLNARTTRPEALLLPIFVWVLLQLLMVLKEQSKPISMFGIGVILGAGWFLLHPNSVVVPGVILGSAFLFSGNPKPALKALLWTVLGMAFGYALYSLIAYFAIGDHAFRGTSLQSVGEDVMGYANAIQSYSYNGWVLIKKWCVFPYRTVMVACVVMAAYGVLKENKMRFLVAASLLYLIVYAVFRSSHNMRYMAYISLMISPLVGTSLADRERIFRPLSRKVFVCIFVLTLASGLGNVYEIWRVRSDSATNLRKTIETNIPLNSTIVGSLWIGGVVPERKLILDLYFPRYFKDHKEAEYYLIEDGLNGETKEVVAFLKKNGSRQKMVMEHSVPRLNYVRISKIVAPSVERTDQQAPSKEILRH
jgi:hypothetical protein